MAWGLRWSPDGSELVFQDLDQQGNRRGWRLDVASRDLAELGPVNTPAPVRLPRVQWVAPATARRGIGALALLLTGMVGLVVARSGWRLVARRPARPAYPVAAAYCPSCGAAAAIGERFCARCGTQLNNAAPASTAGPERPPRPSAETG